MKLKSINPADQSIVGEVETSTSKDIKEAVEAARHSFRDWKKTTIQRRISAVEEFRSEVARQKKMLARFITLEMGKPYAEALNEISFAQAYLKYYVQQGPRLLREKTLSRHRGALSRVVHELVGVSAVITPWNFPILMSIWGLIPNLIAGNTLVFKPSEQTPICGQKVASLLQGSSFPRGVVNIVHGDGRIGSSLVDAQVDLVWFTGSSRVGREIFVKCGQKFIRCLLELGGSSPAIILKDADIDRTLSNVYAYRFFNCGQVCDAVKRLFVHQTIFKDFVRRLTERAKQARVGDPFGNVDFGPLVSRKQLGLLEDQVNDAVEKGARIEAGGRKPEDPSLEKGNYYLPTILTGVNFKMRVLTEEVFGPALPVIPFNDIDEAVDMANRTEYGLSAQIHTRDIKRGREIANRLEAGTVSLNSNNYIAPAFPFGGYKKSGMGREGGEWGFAELTQVKHIFEDSN